MTQPTEQSVTEDIQDGKRFSRSIKKITQNKDLIAKAQKYRDRSAQRALNIGLIEPQDIVQAPDIETQERQAKKKAAAALKIQHANGMHLSQEDIDFINTLPDDGTRDLIITELFSKKVAKKYRTLVENDPTLQNDVAPNDMAREFVKGYIEEYNKLLQGKEHRSLTEIKEDAGYGVTVSTSMILNTRWVAKRIEMYHQSLDKLNEYHYRQIQDKKIREQVKVQDVKDTIIDHLLSHPHEILGANMRDKTQLLRVMNELTQQQESSKTGAPPVAIQINGDIARLAMHQDQEKRSHFENSF